MALVLKQIFATGSDQISQNYAIESWHVSQSVDALTGAAAYDITISGSLNLTGSTLTGSTANITSITGSLKGTASTASYVQTAQTASYVLNAISSSFASTASFVSTASTSITSQTAVLALTVSGSFIPTGSTTPQTPGIFKFIPGYGKTGVTNTATINVPELGILTNGIDYFITIGVSGSSIPPNNVYYDAAGPVITFTSENSNTEFTYLIVYR